MNKVIVTGSGGAGKSYFSTKLAEITGLPLIHLDNIFWREDRTHITREEFDLRLEEELKKEKWIIDGDYSRTYERRIKEADTLFFLDFPLDVCLKGVEYRIGKRRDDIPWKEEIFGPEFRQWIIDWHENKRPLLLELLEKYAEGRDIIIFKSRDEMHEYLSALKQLKHIG